MFLSNRSAAPLQTAHEPVAVGSETQNTGHLAISRRQTLLAGVGLLAAAALALVPAAVPRAAADTLNQPQTVLPVSWDRIPGSLKHVSVGSNGSVWGVNANDRIYRRSGDLWFQESGSLKQISVGSGSQIWGVNANDKIYQRGGNAWQLISGSLKHVSVASDGTVWGVNAQDRIYRRDGDTWTQVPGSLKQISVGSSTRVWGVNANNEIYRLR